jgi:mono/diheme cytochrome c family protein
MHQIKTGNKGFIAALIIISGILLNLLSGCYYDKAEQLYPNTACDTAAVKYSTSVLPVLSSNCINCHGGAAPSAGIGLDSYAGVKTQVDNGRLWGAVAHNPGYSPMPKNSNKLNTCNLEKIRIWIAAGAPNN